MTVRVYSSTDTSAPVLSGQSGALTALLHACLVTGYGSAVPAGWSREFDDQANFTSVFKVAATSPTGTYLRVDDGAPVAAREAQAFGYEAMTSVDAGTNPYPTAVQSAFGVPIRKSSTSDATVRAWLLIASGTAFHFFAYTGDVASTADPFFFGDIASYKQGDTYGSMILGRETSNGTYLSANSYGMLSSTMGTLTGTASWLTRNYSGAVGAVGTGRHAFYTETPGQSKIGGSSGNNYPDTVHGGVTVTPVWLHEATNVIRGSIPGLWNLQHTGALTDGDTLAVVGAFGSRTFRVVTLYLGARALVETSDTWGEGVVAITAPIRITTTHLAQKALNYVEPRTKISGVVQEQGALVDGRTVRVYSRATGELLGTAVTAGGGAYSIPVGYTDQVFVVAFDAAGAPDLNAAILDKLTPA